MANDALIADLAERLLEWFDRHGRHDLPWQHPITPYRVWLSEVMLQQTQVATVIPYFERFVAELPDVEALASASEDRVLALWSGLGYYSRARNLHKAAQRVVDEHAGQFPDTLEGLMALPGVGRSTAGAILSIACAGRAAILDGNVKRVLCRLHRVEGWSGHSAVQKSLWELAEAYTPVERVADYTQAIMDLGATLCTRSKPLCVHCPLATECGAFRAGEVSAYPQPKPRRSIPVRSGWMLIVERTDGAVLLERRPPVGIWGGLWSLPLFDSELALAEQCGVDADDGELLVPFRHTFSHFHLDIQPLRISAKRYDGATLRASPSGWFLAEEWRALGLPAPVRSLLARWSPSDPRDINPRLA